MAKIPRAFIEDLITRVDLVALIESFVPLRKSGRNYMACCPFHLEKTPSFAVSAEKQMYHCFGCGVSGNAISFLMAYEGLSYVEAVYDLAQRAGVPVPQTASANQREYERIALLYAHMAQAAQCYQDQLAKTPAALAYLAQRGLDLSLLSAFQLGYAPSGRQFLQARIAQGKPSVQQQLLEAGLISRAENGVFYDRFWERIVFPLHNRQGRVIAFGARTLQATVKPKYLNSPDSVIYHKGQELYGLYQARQALRHPDYLLVVEGYIDVLALAQRGIRTVVATLGTAVTVAQIQQLFRATPYLIFCFDGDAAGQAAAWKALKTALPLLREGLRMSFLFVAANEDPDSWIQRIGAAAFQQQIEQATPWAAFLFTQIQQQHHLNLQRHDDRVRMVELLRPLLSNIDLIVLNGLLVRLVEVVSLDLAHIRLLIHGHTNHTNTDSQQASVAFQATVPQPQAVSAPLSRIALALILVLQYPELAKNLDIPQLIERWRYLQGREIHLLKKMLEITQTAPKLNSGMLWELVRQWDAQEWLMPLLYQPLAIAEDDLAAVLKDTCYYLVRESLAVRLQQLSQQFPLNAAEKQEYMQLSRELSALHLVQHSL